jgi:hypothetical protein
LSLLTGVARENGGLDGGTVSNSLIGIDTLVVLFAVGEVGDELDDAWDTGGAADENDLVDVCLTDL